MVIKKCLVRRKGFKACETTAWLNWTHFQNHCTRARGAFILSVGSERRPEFVPTRMIQVDCLYQAEQTNLEKSSKELELGDLFPFPYPKTNTLCVWQGIYSLCSCIYFNLIWSFCHLILSRNVQ